MSQKIKTSVEIDGSLSASQIANATTDTDKFLVSDGGVIKYRTGAELATDLGISAGATSKVQHQVKAGVAINKGQAVYVTGADGTNMIVGLASNAAESTSSKTMGLLNATVNVNGFADVITEGLLSGLDTSSAVVGNPVWLGTGGNLIYGLANKPYAPAHLVFIGIVTRVNANNGEIFVKVQNGFELEELHNVDLQTTTPINGHLLGYNGTLWVNKTIAGWLGYTPQAQLNGTGFVKASGTTITYDNTSYYPASNPNGYISSYTETDPTVPSHVKSITTTEKSNWNTAYSWGNHASAGYALSGHTHDLGRYSLRAPALIDGVTASNFRTQLFGSSTSGYNISTARFNTTPGLLSGLNNYGTVMAWSGSDTHGFLAVDYAGPAAIVGGGNADNINWTKRLAFLDDTVPNNRTITINGTSYDLSANRSWTVTASETDTLATVTARGASTSTLSTFDGGLNIGNAKLRWGTNSSPTLGFPFTGGPNAFWIDVNDGDTGGIAIDNDGTTIYGAGDSGHVFRVIDEDVYQGTSNVDTSTTFRIQQGQNGGGYVRGIFEVTDYLTAGNSARAPIFYDSNNTGYYLNPFGQSIFGSGDQYVLRLEHTAAQGDFVDALYIQNNESGGRVQIGMSSNGPDGQHHRASLRAYKGSSNLEGTFGIALRQSNATHVQRLTLTSPGDLTVDSSMRAPIFYDSSDTGYYWNPATDASHRFQTPSGYIDIGPKNGGTCHIYTDRPSFYFNKDILVNGSTVLNTSNAPRAANSYVMFYEGFTLNANDMSTNSTGFTYSNNAPWTGPVARFSTGGGYDLWLNASYGGNGTGLSYRTRNGDAGSYNSWHRIYSDSYRPYADDSGTTGQRSFNYLYTSSYLETSGPVYATIFYDNDNRGYYVDPSNTSNINTAIVNGLLSVAGSTGNYNEGIRLMSGTGSWSNIQFGANTSGVGTQANQWIVGKRPDGNFVMSLAGNQDGGSRFLIQQDGRVQSPVYYDGNNTNYYLDPGGTSNVNDTVQKILRFAGVGGDSGNGSNPDGYAIYQQGGSWTYPYPDLCIGYHTGIKIGAYHGYNGTRFYNNSDWATITASVNDGDNNFRGYYDVIAYASDRRLKHKVEPIKDALSKVKSLTGMTYQWNEIGKEHGWDPDTEVREVGVFAQDVQAVLPEAVRLAPFDDDHGISRSGESFLTVKYDKIVPLLIEAIKEQQTQIEELKELVNKLISK